jgi:hypothetical protein
MDAELGGRVGLESNMKWKGCPSVISTGIQVPSPFKPMAPTDWLDHAPQRPPLPNGRHQMDELIALDVRLALGHHRR